MNIREKVEKKLRKIYGTDYDDINIKNLFDTYDLGSTCTMTELSFGSSNFNSSNLKFFTKKEFEDLLFEEGHRSIITNIVNNDIGDKYLKSVGYEPISSYRGADGRINTYIFINPKFKVRKTSK